MVHQLTNSSAPVTQDELAAAESSEQMAFLASQNVYLLRRVIVLRAQVERQRRELEALRQEAPSASA